jgi:hypothetical protein
MIFNAFHRKYVPHVVEDYLKAELLIRILRFSDQIKVC